MTILRPRNAINSIPNPGNTHILPNLPVELREQIYHLALLPFSSRRKPHRATVTAADAIYGSDARYPCFLPSVCRVNEATRIEIGLWLIRQTEFSILYNQHIVYFSRFLSTFPSDLGFRAIRRLDFQLFGRHKPPPGRPNPYIEFMKRCPELTQVCIKFDVWHLVQYEKPQWIPMASEMVMLDDIAASFGLEQFLDLENLVTLTIELWPRTVARTSIGVQNVVINCWPVLENVVACLRKKFEDRSRKVSVKLLESANAGLRWDGVVARLDMGVQ